MSQSPPIDSYGGNDILWLDGHSILLGNVFGLPHGFLVQFHHFIINPVFNDRVFKNWGGHYRFSLNSYCKMFLMTPGVSIPSGAGIPATAHKILSSGFSCTLFPLYIKVLSLLCPFYLCVL